MHMYICKYVGVFSCGNMNLYDSIEYIRQILPVGMYMIIEVYTHNGTSPEIIEVFTSSHLFNYFPLQVTGAKEHSS